MPKHPDTKKRIVQAASKLFYEEGFRSVSMDAVAAKSGVTKKTLYYHFSSKDELIAEYLIGRDQPNLALFARWYDEETGPVWAKVQNIFNHLARSAAHPKWRGCGFLRTTAELANLPGHPAVKIGAEHKKRFESWMAGELKAAGAREPLSLASQILVLMDGSFSTMLLHRDPAYAEQAGHAAAILVRASLAEQPECVPAAEPPS